MESAQGIMPHSTASQWGLAESAITVPPVVPLGAEAPE